MTVLWAYWLISAAWTVALVIFVTRTSGTPVHRSIVSDGSTVAAPTGEQARRPNGIRISRACLIILLIAGLIRGVFVVMPPTLSDDIYRYTFDGQRLYEGQNPYAGTPQQAIDSARSAGDHATADWLMQINNRELATIYQPVSQWVFASTAALYDALTGRSLCSNSGLIALRIVFSCFDLLAVALLMLALHRAGRSLWYATLYACHPLAITETAWSGHQDAIGIALLVLLWLMVDAVRRDTSRDREGAVTLDDSAMSRIAGGARTQPASVTHPANGRDRSLTVAARIGVLSWVTLGVVSAMVVAVKPMVLPLALPVGWMLRGQWRGLCISIASAILMIALLYAPFALMPGGFDEFLETSKRFVEVWRFNGSLHPLMEWLTGSKRVADGVMGGVVLGVLIGLTWFLNGQKTRGLKAPAPRGGGSVWWVSMVWVMALLMVTSTAHPWYALWALVMLPMCWPVFGWFTLLVMCFTLTLGYSAWVMPDRFAPPVGLQVASWLVVFATLAVEAWVRGARGKPCG
jgi:hypothetical protein